VLLGPVTTHLRLIPLRRNEPVVVAAPVHHGYGLTYVAAGLALGVPVVLAAGLGPAELLDTVARYRAGVLFALPIQLHRLCEAEAGTGAEAEAGTGAEAEAEAGTGAGAAVDRLGTLRAIVSGAAALPPVLLDRLRERFGERVYNLYGTTEAGWAAIATPADLRAAPGTVGRAPRGVRLSIVDSDGTPLPPGHPGEVHVEGWQPGRVPTGDRGYLDRVGRLFLTGRVDDMIVSGGENVYPGPVAEALTTHPEVVDAVLVPVPDPEFGQRLRAVVQVRPGSGLTGDELRRWLRDRLSRAEQPRDIRLVTELPRTSTGKPIRPDTSEV
jgi:acyl-CoA synthetase (AMP-forming)/AMP-acid ligase II